MRESQSQAIAEFGRTKPALRRDLIFTPQPSENDAFYLVEDPVNSKFFRLGSAEYAFISLLDGNTSVHDALRLTARAMPDRALSEHDAAAVCKWLYDARLAFVSDFGAPSASVPGSNREQQCSSRGKWNPLVYRLPLGSPDALLNMITPWVSWVFSRAACCIWFALVLFAAYSVTGQWERFAANSLVIFAPHNWIWLALCWIILKFVHETAHGVSCRLNGGFVRETGLMFILFVPLAYVDVTSSWRFRSKWQRIQTAAAGMYVEIWIAAIAALVWSETAPGVVNNLCLNLVIMAGAATLIFNMNPLMKFDGYYMLSDWLEMPNLYTNGQQAVRHWWRKQVLGVPSTLPPRPRGKAIFIALYGAASQCWRIVVCVSLAVAASCLFHGAGVVLAILAVASWIFFPLARFSKEFWSGRQIKRTRFVFLFGTTAAIIATVLTWCPWPGICEAPAVVEYRPHIFVRAAAPGFLQEVHVGDGQIVEKGHLLAVVRNEELEMELLDLKLAIDQSHLQSRMYESKGNIAALQAELKRWESLTSKYKDKEADLKELVILAPVSGKVMARDLHNLVGTYLKKGDKILSLGNESRKELRVSISQEDLSVFTRRIDKLVHVQISGLAEFSGRLIDVTPRATRIPPHPSLCASAGGRLPVKERNEDSGHAATAGQDYEFLDPRFVCIVELKPNQSAAVRAGQRGTVWHRPCHETVGEHLYGVLAKWFQKKFHGRTRLD